MERNHAICAAKRKGDNKKKKAPEKGLSLLLRVFVLFGVSYTPHLTDYCYFHLSRILHIALNFLGDVET